MPDPSAASGAGRSTGEKWSCNLGVDGPGLIIRLHWTGEREDEWREFSCGDWKVSKAHEQKSIYMHRNVLHVLGC